jgi:uncharacterized membrane protein YjfL (UPF0719 family)
LELLAQTSTEPAFDPDVMGLNALVRHLLAVVVFSLVGVAVLFVCVWVIDKVTPYSFRKEILEDQNTALAILVGAGLIGISMIIAAAVHGP